MRDIIYYKYFQGQGGNGPVYLKAYRLLF